MDSSYLTEEMEPFLGKSKPPAALAEHYSHENLSGEARCSPSRTVDSANFSAGTSFERKAALVNAYVLGTCSRHERNES